jgi:hypothetical protein
MNDDFRRKFNELVNSCYRVVFEETITTLMIKETTLSCLIEQDCDMRFKKDMTLARNNIRNATIHIENALSKVDNETIH